MSEESYLYKEENKDKEIKPQGEENSPKGNKKKNKFKYFLNISFVLIATVVAIALSLFGHADKVLAELKKCDWKILLVVFGLMLVCVCIRSFILFCFARLYTKKYHFHQAVAVDQIGVFYNAVTPGSSGGQLLQAYTYKKQGIQISAAVSILAMYSIVFQTVLIIYGIVSFIVKYDFINQIGSIPFNLAGWNFSIPIWPLTIIGFVLNVGVILIVLLMGYWHRFHNFIMGPCISLLTKIKIVKNPDKKRESLRVSVENFKIELRRLLTNIPFTILVSICFFAYFTIKFSIPYFCGVALGNQSSVANFWDSVFLSNYHQMVTGLIPLPGSAGASEYFFFALFFNDKDPSKGFFYKVVMADSLAEIDINATKAASSALCSAALLIWRTITFTIPLLFAGFVTAFYRASPKEEANIDSDMSNRETFVSIQNETYLERKHELDTMINTSTLSRTAIANKLKSFGKKKTKNTKKNNNNSENNNNDEYTNVNIGEDE